MPVETSEWEVINSNPVTLSPRGSDWEVVGSPESDWEVTEPVVPGGIVGNERRPGLPSVHNLASDYRRLPSEVRDVAEAPGQALKGLNLTLDAAGNVIRGGVADVGVKVMGTPEFGGNVRAALATPIIGAKNGKVTAPDRQPLPVDRALQLAAEDAKEREQFPWASIAGGVSQGIFKAAPKLAALPLAGSNTAAQMIASGLTFGANEQGDIDPKNAVAMGLLPGVGGVIKKVTAGAIGTAIAKGAVALENPIAQKTLEEIGHQAGLNAYMLAVDSPELTKMAQEQPDEFRKRFTEIVANNLGFGLLGVKSWSGRVPSQTEQFIKNNAEVFSQKTLARVAAGDAGRMLAENDRPLGDSRFSPEAPQPSTPGQAAPALATGARFPIPEKAASVLDTFVPETKAEGQPEAVSLKSPPAGPASEWEVVKESLPTEPSQPVAASPRQPPAGIDVSAEQWADMATLNESQQIAKYGTTRARLFEQLATNPQTKTAPISSQLVVEPSKPVAASPEPVVSEAVPTEKPAPTPTETPKQAAETPIAQHRDALKAIQDAGMSTPEQDAALKALDDLDASNKAKMREAMGKELAAQKTLVENKEAQSPKPPTPSQESATAALADVPESSQTGASEPKVTPSFTEKKPVEEDYRGQHQAPMKDSGSPLHDLSGTYPEDIYSDKAARYYGHWGDARDMGSISIIQRFKGKPNSLIRIYRAIPKNLTNAQKIQNLEGQKAYIQKHGKVPKAIETKLNRSDYYDKINAEIERLKALPPEAKPAVASINRGDWVTIDPKYAKEHGEATLNGDFRVISKVVKARDIFTNGDSIHEWGYDPQERVAKPTTTQPPTTPTAAAAKEKAALEKIESGTEPKQTESTPPAEGETGGAQGTVSGAPLGTRPPVPTVPPKAISQIIRDLSAAVGTPIRFGRLTTRKFGGYFKSRENLIGAKKANDIQITSHEVGHKLDDMFSLGSEKSLYKELMHLGDNRRPDSRSSWTPSKTNKYRRGEGVAEFIRYWLTDEAKAKSLAPNLTSHFESILKKYPDLSEQLRQSQEDVHNWRTAEPQARLMSNVSVGSNPNKTRYTLKDLTRDVLDDLYYLKLAVEDVKALGGGELEPSKNPYVLARLLRGGYGVADTFLNRGTVDFKTRNVTAGNSFNDILKPVSKRLNDFRAYIIARQAREMRSQGKETGLEPADVDFTYNKFKDNADFNKAFEDLKKWSDSFIQYSVDAGYMSKESADKIRTMNQEYVPMHRIFEVGADEFGQAGGGSGSGLNQVGNAFKGRHGSRRDIVDPLETYVKNAYSIILNAEKNAVNIAVADLAGKPGFGQFVEKISAPKQIESASLGKLREELEKAGADLSKVNPPTATAKNPSPTADDLLLTFWKDSAIAPRGENVIKVNRDGKLEFYRLSPELYKTMNALDSESASMLSKIISAPAQVLRAGVTLTPDFAIANATRDTFGSAIISRYGKFPVEHTLRGLYALLKDPQLVAEWKASGGGQSVEANYYDRASMQKFLQDKISKDFSYGDYVKFVATSPLKAMRILSGTLEEATRIGEYKRVYDKLKADGMAEGDARRQAGFESRDLQDFAMGGAKTKSLRRATAFWNAAMQGNYRLYQSLKDPATRNQTLLKGIAWVTVPTVTLFAVNKDDKDYWDRPQWERDLFWMVPRGKDEFGHTQFLRVPKPFEIGLLFGTVPERVMAKWFKEDPKAFDGLAGQFANQMLPNPVPQAAMTAAEVSAGEQGYDWFKHRPIVSGSLEHLPPDMQFTQQTSLTARRIGKALGVSPMKVDHVIGGITGTLGKTTVNQGVDRVLEWLTDDKRTARSTFPGARFVATPAGTQSQAVENFYDALEKLRQEDARDKNTKPAKLGNMEAAARRLSELRKQQNKATTDHERQRIGLQMRTVAEKALP